MMTSAPLATVVATPAVAELVVTALPYLVQPPLGTFKYVTPVVRVLQLKPL